jgi:iron(III) transport system ATP-binding protein
MKQALELAEVSLKLGTTQVLEQVSLQVTEGRTLALLGPSGSGKTSLLRVLLGFLAPDSGSVRLHGREVSRAGEILLAPHQRRVAVVFQDLALWPHFTVQANLAFGLRCRGVLQEEQSQRIQRMLKAVNLEGKQDRFPGELSGGEQQRVAMARALVLQPQLLLLDEPLRNLDSILRRDLLQLLRDLLHQHQVTTLYITHEVREAEALAHEVALLQRGRVVQAGTLQQLRDRPESDFVRRLLQAD